jgi:hypothetical protein
LLAAGSAGNAVVDAIAAIVQTGHLGVERVINRPNLFGSIGVALHVYFITN